MSVLLTDPVYYQVSDLYLKVGFSLVAEVAESRLFERDIVSFKEQNLEKHMLSRCLEEGATCTTSIIPWTTSGAFITGALGMSPLEFAPWAFFNYLNPLLSIVLAYLGFGVFRKAPPTSTQ